MAEIAAWSRDELCEIAETDDLHISPFQEDGASCTFAGYLSTIRRYVEAMGGPLDIVASFPHRKPVKIVHIGDLAEEGPDEAELGRLNTSSHND